MNQPVSIATIVLALLGLHLAIGTVFAIAFVLKGVRQIDPHATHGTWTFRLLILPGAAALWPILLRRWIKGIQEPPEQRDAHRTAACAESVCTPEKQTSSRRSEL